MWIIAEMEKQGMTVATASIMREGAKKDVAKLMGSILPKSMLEMCAIPGCPAWSVPMCDYQFYCTAPGHGNLSFAPFCLPEIRVPLDGEEILAGIQIGAVPGSCLKEKFNAISNLDATNLINIVQQAGFFYRVKATKAAVVCIPSTFVLLSVTPGVGNEYKLSDEARHGLRFGLYPKVQDGSNATSTIGGAALQNLVGLGVMYGEKWRNSDQARSRDKNYKLEP